MESYYTTNKIDYGIISVSALTTHCQSRNNMQSCDLGSCTKYFGWCTSFGEFSLISRILVTESHEGFNLGGL